MHTANIAKKQIESAFGLHIQSGQADEQQKTKRILGAKSDSWNGGRRCCVVCDYKRISFSHFCWRFGRWLSAFTHIVKYGRCMRHVCRGLRYNRKEKGNTTATHTHCTHIRSTWLYNAVAVFFFIRLGQLKLSRAPCRVGWITCGSYIHLARFYCTLTNFRFGQISTRRTFHYAI